MSLFFLELIVRSPPAFRITQIDLRFVDSQYILPLVSLNIFQKVRTLVELDLTVRQCMDTVLSLQFSLEILLNSSIYRVNRYLGLVRNVSLA